MAQLFDTSEQFEGLFKEYFNPLCNYVNAQLRNWEDSREVVQNTFAKIWNNKGKLEIHTSAKSYLFQSTRNTMIDFIRKNRKLTTEDKALFHAKNSESENDNLDSYLIRQEIIRSLSLLKPKNRKIFELNKFDGLTYKEIANHLEISERSVEDNIARAIRILREDLKNNENVFI